MLTKVIPNWLIVRVDYVILLLRIFHCHHHCITVIISVSNIRDMQNADLGMSIRY